MRLRFAIALTIQVVAILFSFMGWIDALQGGAAVVMVALLTLVSWAISRVRIPILTWASLLAAIALSVATVALVVIAYDPTGPDSQFENNPLSSPISIVNIVFRVAAVAVIAGTVFYAIRIGDERKKSSRS
jgi:hypothetical protein